MIIKHGPEKAKFPLSTGWYATQVEVSKKDIDQLIQDKYDGSTENRHLLRLDMARLAVGEPLAYVIGWIPFLGLKIYLDSKPLIPRAETEWWTEELIKSLPATELRVLDLCAGSGAIGCAILKALPRAHVSFGELIPEHKVTIHKNISENGLDALRAEVRIGDLFDPFKDERFDVIAANPPYIPLDRNLDESVSAHEPPEALFAGKDGLSIIRRIAIETPMHVNAGGTLWLECDVEHAGAARELIAAHAKSAEIRTDQYGRLRVIVGYY